MLNIFVNTWGNYNENGADGGQWLTLPMDGEELQEALEAIAKSMGDRDPEFTIHDYEWTTDTSFREIDENERITALNEEIQRLDNLNAYEQKVFSAAVECWGYKEVDLDNLDEYNLHEDIKDDYDLGYYWAVESGCYDFRNLGALSNYVDYEGFGRDIRLESDGGHTSFGWIERC